MNKWLGPGLALLLLLTGCRAMLGNDTLRFYDVASGHEVGGPEAVERLRQARLVLVGEQHTNVDHHQAQLAVIRALEQSGGPVAIGLEMFRRQSQAELDRWVQGQMDETQFIAAYQDNWSFDWALYRPIFRYAREHKIPMVGLNVDKGLTRQVAAHGYDTLSDEQKASLGPLTCDVTDDYRAYIREAFGAHAHGEMNFDHFCQAQLVWDTAMAANALKYLRQNPETRMVLLAGAGHAQKQGIPSQLIKRDFRQFIVVLPETPGSLDKGSVTSADADLLYLAP
ncbi:MAG: ChaN family lipoprotein [Desulfobacteraceae bacterium]|nr:ChaN family lipoprotein [Desulfobacteraceae bacterium]